MTAAPSPARAPAANAENAPRFSRLRFDLGIQVNRATTYGIAGAVGLVAMALGVAPPRYAEVLAIVGVAELSAALLHLLYRRGGRLLARVNPDPAWLALDGVLITAGVAISGGADSPWFVWYLANIAGAAFVVGPWAAAAVAAWDTALYLAVAVVGAGGAFDASLARPLAQVVFLYVASFFFVRGVALLQEKRQEIKHLKDDESRKVAELTRLASALDARTRDLAEANLKTREADRLKSQFLANMSHELRTPLNSIIGFSEILLGRAGGLDDKAHRFLANINASGHHLLGLINDILDLSKIEAGKMELHPERFPVASVIEGVCSVVRGTAAARRITLAVDLAADLPALEADPVRVKQVLFNLLSNAVKFSPDGAVVTVAARPLPAAASPLAVDSVEIAVVDRGIGIRPEDHDLVFQEFRQADGATSRRYEGTGLGLALVRRFVELHAGRVALESAPGRGSTFTVTLPAAVGPRQAAAAPEPELEAGLRVLVVEDDPTAFETLAADLDAAGWVPIRARSAEEALLLARSTEPAAVTLDLMLPGADGWAVLRALKADPGTRDVPVVIVSLLDNRELGLALGADDYFVKPVNGAALVARLEGLLPRPRGRVLVVDDDPGVHELLGGVLGEAGYEVEHATSGSEGLAAARRRSPAVVVLDLMMEEMDGFAVADALRADAATGALPVVVLTARELSRAERARLKGKIDALVPKGPRASGRLVATIAGVLRRREAEGAGVHPSG